MGRIQLAIFTLLLSLTQTQNPLPSLPNPSPAPTSSLSSPAPPAVHIRRVRHACSGRGLPCWGVCCCKPHYGEIHCLGGAPTPADVGPLERARNYHLIMFGFGCAFSPDVDWRSWLPNLQRLMWAETSSCPCLIGTGQISGLEIMHRCVVPQVYAYY